MEGPCPGKKSEGFISQGWMNGRSNPSCRNNMHDGSEELTETDPVSEKLCFLVSRIPDDGKVQKNQ
jgi:hypothetical protein